MLVVFTWSVDIVVKVKVVVNIFCCKIKLQERKPIDLPSIDA